MKKLSHYSVNIPLWLIGIALLLSCGCAIQKSDIALPPSQPLPHALLQKMQSITPIEKEGEIIFNGSKMYTKQGIVVLLLKGSPYETGFARGILLKRQIHQWAIDCIYMIKRMGFGNLGLNLARSRTKEIAAFIPQVYKEEMQGISAGCKIAYDTILMLNVLDTIGKQFACTSVAIRDKKGDLLRSRSLDFKDLEFLRPSILTIYKPDQGNAFACVGPVANIGVFTAINEKGLTFGVHDITGSTTGWKGMPAGLIYRTLIQNADTVDEAAQILDKTAICLPQMALVSDPVHAAVLEFDSKNLKTIRMQEDFLILTNFTRALNRGIKSENSLVRYREADHFLKQHKSRITPEKLVELHCQPFISTLYNTVWTNIHSAVFNSNTGDFWIAVDPPKASRGKWVRFNLAHELSHF